MRSRTLYTFAPLTLILALGCATYTSADDEPTTDASQALDAEDDVDARPPRAHRGPHGPMVLFDAALHELDLSDTQRAAIEKARASLAPPEDVGRDHAEARKALAAAIRAGSVSEDMGPGDPAEHMKAMRATIATALQELHRALRPEQRAGLVSAVEDRAPHEHGPRDHGPREHGPRDHGPRDHGPRDRAEKPHHGPPPLHHLLGDLDLSDEQRAAIDAALEKHGLTPPAPPGAERMKAAHDEMRQRERGFLEAFARADFDANAALPIGPPRGAKAPPKLGRVLAVIVPLLDEAQREALAERFERGPASL